MTTSLHPEAPLWTPGPEEIERSHLHHYLAWLEGARGRSFNSYFELWRWSIEDIEEFWASLWDYFQVRAPAGYDRVLTSRAMPEAQWFPGAYLNYVDHALGASPEQTALIARSETRDQIEVTYGQLRDQVAAAAAGLRRLGVGPGDRVAAYLPNIPEAAVAFLAAASLGAIWSSCSPEFGVGSVIDRFRQIEPKVLLAIDGYVHAGRRHDRLDTVREIRARLPSLEHLVLVPYLDSQAAGAGLDQSVPWAALLAEPAPLVPEPVPFSHPLWVLYSSGTTGLPKPLVHGHGGILLEHLKALAFHKDIGPGDRFFWQTTTGWMMWNFLLGGLLRGATVVLYDGAPGYPSLDVLWQMTEELGVTYFGTNAAFVQSCLKEGLRPGARHDLSALRAVGSTGSPLSPEGFDWVYTHVKPDLLLGSTSGGTDLCTAFVGPCPLLPVWKGELQCRMLGADVQAFDESGQARIEQVGELVITKPLPSMPLFLWGDRDGTRLRESYFGMYPGVWRHGDWIKITRHGGCVIYGRSDSTLNRAGVRMGTAEFYRVVEAFPEVADSLIVDTGQADETGRLLLFLVLAPDARLDEGLRGRLVQVLRSELSPRHVPDEILEIESVPRTLTGKKMEVPVKRILAGADPAQVAAKDSMADPAALDPFVRWRQGQRA